MSYACLSCGNCRKRISSVSLKAIDALRRRQRPALAGRMPVPQINRYGEQTIRWSGAPKIDTGAGRKMILGVNGV